MDKYTMQYPAGLASKVQLTATGTQNITIKNSMTFIDGVTVQGTADRTLALDIDTELKAGAIIFLQTKTAGTENTIFSTGFTAPTYVGVAGKTKCQMLVFDGGKFKPAAVAFQID